MNFNTALAGSATALVLLATAASAQTTMPEWGATVTLGYGSVKVDGEKIDSRTVDFAGTVAFDNGFGADLDLSYNRLSYEGEDINLSYVAIAPHYTFAGGFTGGLYYERGKLGISGLSDDVTLSSYGVTAGYVTDMWSAEAYYGTSDTDPSLSGVDIKDYGVMFAAAPMPKLSLAANLQRSRLSSGGTDVDLDVISLAASYNFVPQAAVYGALSKGSVGLLDLDIDNYAVGLSYDFSGMSPLPVIASLEVARTTLSLSGFSEDIDSVRFGVTLPFGPAASKTPLNSTASTIMTSPHSVINSAIVRIF